MEKFARGAGGKGAAGPNDGWLATGGMIGAVLVSSCCIAPLVFVLLGVSGAWIGNLTALEPYRLYFAALALVFIGLGFRRVYFTARPACDDGAYCARPRAMIITKSALWVAAVLVAVALSVNWWAPLFY